MALYTFGGTPADVMTDAAGNTIPDRALSVLVAGTGAPVTALYESDGVTPIGTLRSNPIGATVPGAIRTFLADVPAIEYEYPGPGGATVRWYQQGRELATEALQIAQSVQADQVDAADVNALIAAQAGAPNGLAQIGPDGKLLESQTPTVGQVLVGETGRRYRLLSAVIRNSGSGWEMIDDGGHRPSGIQAIATRADRIELQHAVGGQRVSSLQVTPDEVFAAQGLRCGASVGIDLTNIYLYTEPADRISDLITYNGSAWVSEAGVFTGFAFSGGVLTLTHPNMGAEGSVAIAQRGGTGAFAAALTPTTTQIVFYTGGFGSLAAASPANNTMRCYVNRFGKRGVPPTAPASVVSSTGNLWITGLIEL